MSKATKNKLMILAIIGLVIFSVNRLTMTNHSIQGQSSSPAIQEGDNLYGYTFLDPKRGEFSMWYCAECGGNHVGKYTLAIPGDHLVIEGESIYVNGTLETTAKGSGFDYYDGVMGEDEYFVIGLNPNHSVDSRQLGTFSINDHISRVVKVKENNKSTVYAADINNSW